MGATFAQSPEPESSQPDPVESAAIQWSLDSLIPSFHYKTRQYPQELLDKYEAFGYAEDYVPLIPEDSTRKWLYDLGSPIPLDYNEYVQQYINMYVLKRRGQVSRMLGLQEVFFPIFEAELDRQGLPSELKYLPIVESALNPHARSRVGATGLWQFMYETGKLYGLKVDSYIDERQDPYKSSEAAVRYLKNMYKSYGDWLLVIAAYNCGPGNVNKAIRRAGGATNFWAIRQYLPRETAGYVPAFIAANYVMQYAPEHNIRPTLIEFSYHQDTLHFCKEKLTLDQIAAFTNSDIHTLKDMNPELKSHHIPYTITPYPLRVPFETALVYAENQDSINKLIAANDSIRAVLDSSRVSPITHGKYANGYAPVGSNPVPSGTAGPNGTVQVWHTVRSGEVVGAIASRYHVSASDIARWNGLYKYRIKVGQKLKIYVPEKYAKTTSSTKPATTPAVVQSAPPQKPSVDGKRTYTVKEGDTLWDIAAKYDGVTVDRLISINNLNSSKLSVGQTLVIE